MGIPHSRALFWTQPWREGHIRCVCTVRMYNVYIYNTRHLPSSPLHTHQRRQQQVSHFVLLWNTTGTRVRGSQLPGVQVTCRHWSFPIRRCYLYLKNLNNLLGFLPPSNDDLCITAGWQLITQVTHCQLASSVYITSLALFCKYKKLKIPRISSHSIY